jgi:hypothetical protein
MVDRRRPHPSSKTSSMLSPPAVVPIDRTHRLDEIVQAHRHTEDGRATGKLVIP